LKINFPPDELSLGRDNRIGAAIFDALAIAVFTEMVGTFFTLIFRIPITR